MKRIIVGLITLSLAIGLMVGCQLNAPESIDQTQVSAAADELIAASADLFASDIVKVVYVKETGDGNNDGSTGGENGTYDDPDGVANDDDTILDPDTDDLNTADYRFTMTFTADGTWEWKMEQFEWGDTTNGDDFDTLGGKGEGWVQTKGLKGTFEYDETARTLTVGFQDDAWATATETYPAWSSSNPPAGIIKTMKNYIFLEDIVISDLEATNGGNNPTLANVVAMLDPENYYLGGTQETIDYLYESGYPSSKFTEQKYQLTYEFTEADKEFIIKDNGVDKTSAGVYSDGGISVGYEMRTWTSANGALDSGAAIKLEDVIDAGDYNSDWAYDSTTKAYKLASSPTLNKVQDNPYLSDVNIQAYLDADGEVDGYRIW